ncbi:MAG: cupin domain-containing protein [Myxococcota bacterium]
MQAHDIESGRALNPEDLAREGVHYQALAVTDDAYQPALDRLKAAGGYITQDQVELRPDTPGLNEICQKFDAEHFHEEDEVRFVLEGEAIFDIRSRDDRWMRVKVEEGDLIVVPARRYHRFELTGTQNIRCVRLFQDESGWVAHYR